MKLEEEEEVVKKKLTSYLFHSSCVLIETGCLSVFNTFKVTQLPVELIVN